jgi:hypothetical protein
MEVLPHLLLNPVEHPSGRHLEDREEPASLRRVQGDLGGVGLVLLLLLVEVGIICHQGAQLLNEGTQTEQVDVVAEDHGYRLSRNVSETLTEPDHGTINHIVGVSALDTLTTAGGTTAEGTGNTLRNGLPIESLNCNTHIMEARQNYSISSHGNNNKGDRLIN